MGIEENVRDLGLCLTELHQQLKSLEKTGFPKNTDHVVNVVNVILDEFREIVNNLDQRIRVIEKKAKIKDVKYPKALIRLKKRD